jgi:hypothetical protein
MPFLLFWYIFSRCPRNVRFWKIRKISFFTFLTKNRTFTKSQNSNLKKKILVENLILRNIKTSNFSLKPIFEEIRGITVGGWQWSIWSTMNISKTTYFRPIVFGIIFNVFEYKEVIKTISRQIGSLITLQLS